MLRSQHATMKKQQERKGSIQQSVKPKHIKQAETKRQAVSIKLQVMLKTSNWYLHLYTRFVRKHKLCTIGKHRTV